MDEIIKKLKEQDSRFDQLDKQVDLLARTAVAHTERLDRIEDKLDGMVTKGDNQKVMNTLDEILKLAKKKDEELTVLVHNLKRMDDKVEKHDKDIKQMKPALGLS